MAMLQLWSCCSVAASAIGLPEEEERCNRDGEEEEGKEGTLEKGVRQQRGRNERGAGALTAEMSGLPDISVPHRYYLGQLPHGEMIMVRRMQGAGGGEEEMQEGAGKGKGRTRLPTLASTLTFLALGFAVAGGGGDAHAQNAK